MPFLHHHILPAIRPCLFVTSAPNVTIPSACGVVDNGAACNSSLSCASSMYSTPSGTFKPACSYDVASADPSAAVRQPQVGTLSTNNVTLQSGYSLAYPFIPNHDFYLGVVTIPPVVVLSGR